MEGQGWDYDYLTKVLEIAHKPAKQGYGLPATIREPMYAGIEVTRTSICGGRGTLRASDHEDYQTLQQSTARGNPKRTGKCWLRIY